MALAHSLPQPGGYGTSGTGGGFRREVVDKTITGCKLDALALIA